MKKFIMTLVFLVSITGIAIAQTASPTDSAAAINKAAATVVANANTSTTANTPDLNGVTFGFGAGYSYTFDQTYDYSLTTDATHSLKLQPLKKQAFVISSVVMVKLSKISFDQSGNTFVKQGKKSQYAALKTQVDYQSIALNKQIETLNKTASLVAYNPADSAKKIQAIKSLKVSRAKLQTLDSVKNTARGIGFKDHLSINLAMNLADISPDVTFNKSVNGGIGLGYFITDNLQLALFYDISQTAQLRDYVVSSYQNKPIPEGSGTNYTALSTTDNNLFYNKTISGLSFKLIFSIGNQKASASTGSSN